MNPALAGLLAALLSSATGGASVAATRFVAGAIDPIALGAFRFGIGAALLAPLAWLGARRAVQSQPPTPTPRLAWLRAAGLGMLMFGGFPLLFNLSLHFTTAARGALALSTMPLLTLALAIGFGAETASRGKLLGVMVALAGVALALRAGLASAPPGAWRGDLLMVAAAGCGAVYNVASRPTLRRVGVMPFTAAAMAAGASTLLLLAAWHGSFASVASFGRDQWISIGFLGVFGGALAFYLWSYALSKIAPSLVALSVAVNPVVAAVVGWALLGEAVGWNLVLGLIGVVVGIGIAMSQRRAVNDA